MTLRPALLALALALAAAPVLGQSFLREVQRLGLGQAEWKAMNEAAKSLYSPTVAEAGATAEWRTPSGAYGTVSLIEAAPRADGAECVRLRHDYRPTAAADPRGLPERRCRQPDGSWAIAAE